MRTIRNNQTKSSIFTLAIASFILSFGIMIVSEAGEFSDDFKNEVTNNWEVIQGNWNVGRWKEGWYSVQAPENDANVAISLIKAKVGGKDILFGDGITIEGRYLDSGGGGRNTVLVVFSYTPKEAYLGGGFIGGRQVWAISKIDPTPGVGYKAEVGNSDLILMPMAGSKAGSKGPNMEFTIKVEGKGKKVNVFIDNKEAVSWEFKKGLPNGRVGLASVQNNGNWGWIRVTGSSLRVDGAGKLATSWGAIKR